MLIALVIVSAFAAWCWLMWFASERRRHKMVEAKREQDWHVAETLAERQRTIEALRRKIADLTLTES